MRRALHDYGILVHEEEFIGISLGYDYCAEHEWGIDETRNLFKIPEPSKKNLGIKNKTITKCPDRLLFKKDGNYAVLWVAYENWRGPINEELPCEFKNYKSRLDSEEDWNRKRESRKDKDTMISAWSDGYFGVAVKGKKGATWLEFLYNQFKKLNVAITYLNISGNNPFANSSLSLVIANRLPKEFIRGFYNADKKRVDLINYKKKIGMTKLKEKKKGSYHEENWYMACSPRWIDYEDKKNREKRKKELKTKYNIQYWINYSDDDYNYGWYTVEDIKKWLSTDGLKLTEINK